MKHPLKLMMIALMSAGLVACTQVQDLFTRNASNEAFAEQLAQALASEQRPEADRARDATRKPVEVITFLGISSGDKVIDLIAAGGYYTEVLSHAVGPEGKVCSQNPAYVLKFRDGANDKALTERLAGDRLPNVIRWDREISDLGLKEDSLDGAITALNFHDVYNGSPENGIAMLKAVFAVLKPGGVLGVIDHRGDGGNDNKSLHRIEEQLVIEAAESAGFTVEATSQLLANPQDDRTLRVFDPAVRGQTDRFLLRLRKPK